MIETTIPEINVVELMERVRAKAEEIRRLQARPKLPAIPEPEHAPRAILPTPVVPKTQQIMQAMHDARRAANVSRWIPKPLRVFFRRQDHFDRDVLRSIESLAHTNAQLADRLRHLSACVEVQDHAIQHLSDLRRLDGNWMRAVADIVVTANERLADLRAAIQTDVDSRLTAIRAEFAASAQRLGEMERELHTLAARMNDMIGVKDLAAGCRIDLDQASEHLRHLQDEVVAATGMANGLRSDVERTSEHLRNLDSRFQSTTEGFRGDIDRAGEHLRHLQHEVERAGTIATGCRTDLDRAGEHLRNLDGIHDKLATDSTTLRSALERLSGEFRVIRDTFDRTGEHLRNLQSEMDRAKAEFERPLHLDQAISQLEQRLTDDSSYLKAELAQQRTTISHLATLRNGKVAAKQARNKRSAAASSNLDSFYVSFEDRFRGSRRDIKQRLRFYVPIVKSAHAGSEGRPVLDVGCGRGEWLELLKDNHLIAEGVDLNATMQAQCDARGLRVTHGDALEYLQHRKPASAGAVTGFHIIEHLPFDALLELLALSYRVLKPGGLVIFESPNCKNLVVGACNFNIDPTHRNPVHPDTAEFMLKLNGFERTRIEYLSPVEGSPFKGKAADTKFLDDRLFGPQDFGVIGYKPVRQ